MEDNKILNIISIDEALKKLKKAGKRRNKEKEKLEALIGDLKLSINNLNKEIEDIKYKINEEKINKEGWEGVLEVSDVETEEYKKAQEEIEKCEISIANYNLEIDDKKKQQERYSDQLNELEIKKKNGNDIPTLF